MKRDNSIYALVLLSIVLFGWILFYPNSRVTHLEETSPIVSSKLYYESITDTTEVNWSEYIPIFHFWKNISEGDYLFDVPSAEQVASWQNLCEQETPSDSVM